MVNIISAGHQPGGGAYGIISETDENRKVVKAIKNIDKTFLDVTINTTTDANSELIQKVKKVNELCKSNEVYCYSDIHFNAFNGQAKGVECIILGYESGLYNSKESYDSNYSKAKKVCDSIAAATGLFNRGVKVNNEFYVLRATSCHSMIIEICFLDNKEDMSKYNLNKVASAIVKGLGGQVTEVKPPVIEKPIVAVKPSMEEYEMDSYVERGKCTICVGEGVFFYDKPSISKVTGSYEYNESVTYDYVVITNKYVYVSWKSASTGARRYMPVYDKLNKERWGNCV